MHTRSARARESYSQPQVISFSYTARLVWLGNCSTWNIVPRLGAGARVVSRPCGARRAAERFGRARAVASIRRDGREGWGQLFTMGCEQWEQVGRKGRGLARAWHDAAAKARGANGGGSPR